MNIRFLFVAAVALTALSVGCSGNSSPTDTDVTGDSTADTSENKDSDHTDIVDDAADGSGDQDVPAGKASIAAQPSSINFGTVAAGTTKTAQLNIINTGLTTLTVSSLEIVTEGELDYEFALVQDAAFPPTLTEGSMPADILPGDNAAIELTARPVSPANGAGGSAKLVIRSNAMNDESLEVPLTVGTIEQGFCVLTMVPGILSLGTFATGFPKTVTARLVNTGTGACSIKTIKAADCEMVADEWDCPAPPDGQDSPVFDIVSPETLVGTTVEPGSSTNVSITANIPSMSPEQYPVKGWAALFSVVAQASDGTESTVPTCGAACDPNLLLPVGTRTGEVRPEAVSFGDVVTGCSSSAKPICLYNPAPIPIELNSIDSTGCSDEFALSGTPALPASIEAGSHICFDAVYIPADSGADECAVSFTFSNTTGIATVELSGNSLADRTRQDTFAAPAANDIDILFVLDDSGSMCDDMANLSDAVPAMLDAISNADGNVHVGVIGMNIADEGVAGKLNLGRESVSPRFLVGADITESNLRSLLSIGCDGGSDDSESGLESALVALSAPLVTNTGFACSTDADCRDNTLVCENPLDCPYSCINDICGGFNSGFLRNDAALEIIIVSDEDDQSIRDTQYYSEFFKSLKPDRPGLVHVNAVVGVSGVPADPDEGTGCQGQNGISATTGTRYIDVAQQTDGKIESICNGNFDDVLTEIAGSAFQISYGYFLSRLADENTISVFINGVECTSGWMFAPQSNSIVFDTEGACVPQQGDTVTVTYDMLCLHVM